MAYAKVVGIKMQIGHLYVEVPCFQTTVNPSFKLGSGKLMKSTFNLFSLNFEN